MMVQFAQQQASQSKISAFEDEKIRRIFYNGEWYVSLIDIVDVLTDSLNARRYWSDLKKEECDQLYGKDDFQSSNGIE